MVPAHPPRKSAKEASMHTHPSHPLRHLLLVALAGFGAGIARADSGGHAPAAARYEAERAACLRGYSPQSVDTCLREAAAARAEAGRSSAQDDDAARLRANQQRRCEPLPDELRRDCIVRMQGEGTVSGSVAGGGIYRELITEIETEDRASKAESASTDRP
jgi:hypothetical protein